MEWTTGLYVDSEYDVVVLGVQVIACTNPNCRTVVPLGGASADTARRVLYALKQRDDPQQRPPGWKTVDTVVRVTPGAPPAVYDKTRTIWDMSV